jgi:hypothetical protein
MIKQYRHSIYQLTKITETSTLQIERIAVHAEYLNKNDDKKLVESKNWITI